MAQESLRRIARFENTPNIQPEETDENQHYDRNDIDRNAAKRRWGDGR
jgi:hypothetical protein